MPFSNVKNGVVKTWVVSAILLALLAGCSSLDKTACVDGDWRAIGYEDGVSGQLPSQIDEHRNACARHGIVPDDEAYKVGYLEGTRVYCTEARGFEVGRDGDDYNGACPKGEPEQDFLDGYQLGREHYVILKEISHYRSQINTAESRLKSLRNDMRDIELRGTTRNRSDQYSRTGLPRSIYDYQREITELEAKINQLNQLKAAREAEYNQLETPVFDRETSRE